jgi:hypothetical protein
MEPVTLWRLRIFPTLRCNLKCRLCTVYSPYYKHPPEYDTAVFKRDIKRVFELIDTLNDFEISGGEPLVKADLSDYYSIIAEYDDRISGYIMVTNGSILPSENLLAAMKPLGKKLKVLIDDYGDLSVNAEKANELYQKNGNRTELRKQKTGDLYLGGWLETTVTKTPNPFSDNYTEIRKNCSMYKRPLFDLKNGIFYHCDKSIYYYDLLGSPPDENETINIFSGEDEATLKNKIINFHNRPYFESCKHCTSINPNGTRFPAAQQLSNSEITELKKMSKDVAEAFRAE